MTFAPRSIRRSASLRLSVLVWPVAGLLGYLAGTFVAGGLHSKAVLLLLVLPALVLVARIEPEKLFVAWLFVALGIR